MESSPGGTTIVGRAVTLPAAAIVTLLSLQSGPIAVRTPPVRRGAGRSVRAPAAAARRHRHHIGGLHFSCSASEVPPNGKLEVNSPAQTRVSPLQWPENVLVTIRTDGGYNL